MKNRKHPNISYNQSGYTLIELIIVIAILSIIAAVGITRLSGLPDKASETADKANLEILNHATVQFIIANPIGSIFASESETDEDRMLALVTDKYIDEKITPQTEDVNFQWDLDKMLWVTNLDETSTTGEEALPEDYSIGSIAFESESGTKVFISSDWTEDKAEAIDNWHFDIGKGFIYKDETGIFITENSGVHFGKNNISSDTTLLEYYSTGSGLTKIDPSAPFLTTDDIDSEDNWSTIPTYGDIYSYNNKLYIWYNPSATKWDQTDPTKGGGWVEIVQP